MRKWLFLWNGRPQCNTCKLYTWLTLSDTGTVPTMEISLLCKYYKIIFFSRFIESMGVCANDCFFGIGVHSVKCAIYTGWRLIALEPYPQRNYLSNYHNNHTSRYTDSMGVGGNDCSFWHRRQQCNLGLYTPLTTSDTGAVSPTELRNLVCSMQINLIDLILHGGFGISNSK